MDQTSRADFVIFDRKDGLTKQHQVWILIGCNQQQLTLLYCCPALNGEQHWAREGPLPHWEEECFSPCNNNTTRQARSATMIYINNMGQLQNYHVFLVNPIFDLKYILIFQLNISQKYVSLILTKYVIVHWLNNGSLLLVVFFLWEHSLRSLPLISS